MEFPFKKNYSLSVNELFINLQNYQYKLIHDSFNNKITSFKTNILGKPANFGYYGPLLKDTFNTIIASSEDYDKIDILVDVIGQEEQRLKAKKIYTSCSAWDYYHSDEGHKNLVNNLTNKNKEINGFNLREELYELNIECTQFKPTLALAIYKIFQAKSILDISAGWGDRLVAALACTNVTRYLGFDPNTDLRNGHDKIKALVSNNKNFEIIYQPFENAQIDEQFDLCFSSPPFFNIENYTTLDGQSILNYPKFNDWMCNFLFKSMINAWNTLKMEGHLVLHFSDTKEYKMCEIMVLFALYKLDNCQFDGVISSLASSASNFYRPIWVFRKTTKYDVKKQHALDLLNRNYPNMLSLINKLV